MPRIRTIKPQFWSSEQIVECSLSARLLFIGLWNFADDRGVLPASSKRLKMQIFPGDPITADEMKSMLEELLGQELLKPFTVNGKNYWLVTGWSHQKIDRPTYHYPAPNFDEVSTSNPRAITASSPPEEEKEEEIDIRQVAKATQPLSSTVADAGTKQYPQLQEIFTYWQEKTNHPKAKLDSKRRTKILAAIKLGFDLPALKQAIDGCTSSEFHMGKNEQKQRYDAIDLIFRDAAHIEKFIEMASSDNSADDIFVGCE